MEKTLNQTSEETPKETLLGNFQEFSIDLDFKKFGMLEDSTSDSDDEDSEEDHFKNIETTTDKLMLSSPEYHTFEELATNMIDCVPSGAVKLLIIEEGDGPLVPIDAEVTIHYAAYWEKASIPFDSTITMNYGAPMKFRLGSGRILPGLEVGITTVHGPSARFHLLLAPEATWGAQGILPRIRPERCLFIVHLYDVKDMQAGVRFNDLPREEQTKFEVTTTTVRSLHMTAKDLFVKKAFRKAIKNYEQSISVLCRSKAETEEQQDKIRDLNVKSYVNLAVCYYKIQKPKYVIFTLGNLENIIDIENHCKALFYYGRAYEMLGKSDEAIKYYKKALKLEPKNKEIGQTLASFDRNLKESAAQEKELWQNAFKSVPKGKKSGVYDVDRDFQNGVRDMCQDLAGRDEYARFDLPSCLTRNELNCIKSICEQFEKIVVQEDGEGKRKRISIIKKC